MLYTIYIMLSTATISDSCWLYIFHIILQCQITNFHHSKTKHKIFLCKIWDACLLFNFVLLVFLRSKKPDTWRGYTYRDLWSPALFDTFLADSILQVLKTAIYIIQPLNIFSVSQTLFYSFPLFLLSHFSQGFNN